LAEAPEVIDRPGLSDPFLSSGAVPWEKEKQIPPRAGEDGQQVGAADHARRRLAQACQQLDGSRALVIALPKERRPPIVQCLVERRLTVTDSVVLESLRQGLDRIAHNRTRRESAKIS
jgi:hypothetical protein